MIATINGGLGDNLVFSTLPELYAARGIPVYLHAANRYRNPEIYALVWGANPYVAGRSDAPPNAGAGRFSAAARDFASGLGGIGRLERAHGFPGEGRYPRVYYEPRRDPRFADRVLVDLSSTSVPFDYPGLAGEYLTYVCGRYGYALGEAVAIEFASRVSGRSVRLRGLEQATIATIFEYCDAIFSARALITVESGAHLLASALKADRPAPRIHALFSAKGFNERLFVMPNVEYCVTGHVPLDVEFPPLP